MDYCKGVCKHRSGYDVWTWILLKSVALEKIPWKLTSWNFWHFNRMGDWEENENKVWKNNEEVADNGVSSEKTNDCSWLYKTLESFSFLFDEQQMQREVYMWAMQEMKETTNQ